MKSCSENMMKETCSEKGAILAPFLHGTTNFCIMAFASPRGWGSFIPIVLCISRTFRDIIKMADASPRGCAVRVPKGLCGSGSCGGNRPWPLPPLAALGGRVRVRRGFPRPRPSASCAPSPCRSPSACGLGSLPLPRWVRPFGAPLSGCSPSCRRATARPGCASWGLCPRCRSLPSVELLPSSPLVLGFPSGFSVDT